MAAKESERGSASVEQAGLAALVALLLIAAIAAVAAGGGVDAGRGVAGGPGPPPPLRAAAAGRLSPSRAGARLRLAARPPHAGTRPSTGSATRSFGLAA